MNAHTNTAQFARPAAQARAIGFEDAVIGHACAFNALVAATTSKSGKVSKAVERKYDDATDRLCGMPAIDPMHTAYKLGAAYALIETGNGSNLTKELAIEIVHDDTREVVERLIASAWLDLMAEDNRRRSGSASACGGDDPDAVEYLEQKTLLDFTANLGAGEGALAANGEALNGWDAATNRLLDIAPTSLFGVEVRLRAILEQGACRGLFDHHPELYTKYADAAVTAEDLYGEHGCGTNDAEVLYRAMARLHRGVVALNASHRPSTLKETDAAWSAARSAFLAAQRRWLELGDAGTAESEQAFTDQLAAEMAYAQTPPPSLEALATMLRDVLNFDAFPGRDDRADNRESIQNLLDDDEPGMNYLAMAYQHVTRLVGEVGEIHEARRGIPTQRGLTDAEFNARVAAQSAAA